MPEVPALACRREDLHLGELLAEGGEGRVFALPRQPHLVFKQYRRPDRREYLAELAGWPHDSGDGMLSRVRSAASWPEMIVEEAAPGSRRCVLVSGVLMPRAPRRFALRHRDGGTRLATLSYLTADPAHRAVAYGLDLPPAFSAQRLGIVYALARLVEAFERSHPPVGHGDLSAKNVLWSLQRGPEVFVIDCDNCERFGPTGEALSARGRRRAMTPNWDDPAVEPGTNPGLEADRYSLALIFLRVAGAANFPVQPRQRLGHAVSIDFPVPPGYAAEALVGPTAPLWNLCSRGLSLTGRAERPPASAWVAVLEAVLDGVGAGSVMRAVWETQGGGPSVFPVDTTCPVGSTRVEADDVRIRPVVAGARRSPPARRFFPALEANPAAGRMGPAGRPRALATPTWTPGTAPGSVPSVSAAGPAPVSVRHQIVEGSGVALRWWASAHRSLMRSVRERPGERRWVRHLAVCVAVDLACAAVGLFIGAMAVAPVLGI